ncbi:MAG: peptide ABC transporter substrate-binding protein [Chloroflexales bacterium]|nr:peptide ABC transporter substrate-binding protein [Chloroflexales bacterium]
MHCFSFNVRRSSIWLGLFILSFCLNACSVDVAPSPDPRRQLDISQPTPRVTDVPPTAVPTKLPTPSLPTAVPPTPPPSVSGRYINLRYGVSLEYPSSWRKEAEGQQAILLQLVSPGGNGLTLLLSPISSGASLEESTREVRERLIYSDDIVRYTSNGTAQVDGRPAWLSEYVVSYDSFGLGSIVFRQLAVAQRGWMFTLMSYGEATTFTRERAELLAVEANLKLPEPEIFGIPRNQALVLAGGESNNPRDYDPATGGGSSLVFSGLVSFNPQLEVVPDLAEAWEISVDGTVYTFQLRENARFHDGRPVTAADVAYSWERAADPATGSNVILTSLGDIVGVRAKYAGEAERISGLEVLNDRLLRVTLEAPTPTFLMKLTMRVAAVVDRANVEVGPKWYRTPNGAGPYRLIRWDSFELQVYERNEAFYRDPPPIQYIIVRLSSAWGTQLYEVGDIDIAAVGFSELDRMRNPLEPLRAELREGVTLCTSFIVFDTTRPPFDDRLVRQAFASAIDKQRYLDVGLENKAILAHGTYPPGLAAYTVEAQDQAFDPELARQQLAESEYGGPAELPPITFTSYGHSSYVDDSVAALIEMWKTNLDVEVKVENLDPNHAQEMIYAGEHGQLVFWNWCADYPDPESFANTLFHSDAQQNIGGYTNAELDEILHAARIERDPARRIALYQEAEQAIVDDAAAIFLTHSLNYVLVKPYVEGYVLTPITTPIERYLSLTLAE